MRAPHFLLLILFVFSTSFFWEDEEKQLRQLLQAGETALQKKEFEAAKKAFEELFGRIGISSSQKFQVDWRTYIDVANRLATIYEALDEKEEAKRVLSLILAKNPPKELSLPLKLMRARFAATGEAPIDAYLEMKGAAEGLPFEAWPIQEFTFYQALEHTLNRHFDEQLRKAKLYLAAGMVGEAVVFYEEIQGAIENSAYPKVKTKGSLLSKIVRYRLAECHFLMAKYDHSLSYLSTEGGPHSIDREMIHLSALCYREQREYEKAVELFQAYTHQGDPHELVHYDQALFEIGHYYFQRGQSVKAKRYLEKAKRDEKSSLLLAKIYLEENEPRKVEELLAPLRVAEAYYLRGQAAYTLGEYGAARDAFERSLSTGNQEKWASDSLYQLGWCYLQLADDHLKSEGARHRFFDSAEENFHRLLPTDLNEEATLSLAELYLTTFRHFKDEVILKKMEALLDASEDQFSLEKKLEALLLRAEAAPSYVEKEKIYSKAIADRFWKCPLYGQAWYYRGLNQLTGGNFDQAIASFEKAFGLVEKEDRELAKQLLKVEARANICRNFPIISLALLEKLLSEFEETPHEKEETLYLKGFLSAQLSSESYFPIAEESLKQVIELYPEGKHRAEALFTLGTLYYRHENYPKALENLSRLAREYPQAIRAPEAWFWSAEAASHLGQDAFSIRQHVYEDYPQSASAPEAYFRQYAYSLYREGQPEALRHLKEFGSHFAQTPLEIVIYYLLGLHEQEAEMAASQFEKGLSAYAHYQQSTATPDPLYLNFRYQMILDLADRYLIHSLEESEKILCSLIAEFDPESRQNILYPRPLEEAEFKLVQCYLKGEKVGEAQRLLEQMLLHYRGAGITEGDFFSRVWLEQGRLGVREHDYNAALNCFEIALATTGSEQIGELDLTLWLLESDCYRNLKQYDQAMRLLSKVINAERASPLRIKAMYLRSELYALEGRHELAIRQLESVAKKGGEWAIQAKDTLKRNYGIE